VRGSVCFASLKRTPVPISSVFSVPLNVCPVLPVAGFCRADDFRLEWVSLLFLFWTVPLRVRTATVVPPLHFAPPIGRHCSFFVPFFPISCVRFFCPHFWARPSRDYCWSSTTPPPFASAGPSKVLTDYFSIHFPTSPWCL